MRDDITNSEIEEYLASLMPPRPSPLNDMERIGRESGWPLVGAVEGQFLYMLARTSGVQHALEIGTATGYAAIWLLKALVQNPEGRLTAIEKDPLRYTRAREWVAKAGYSDRISIHEGDWFEELANMRGPFDLIFLDILRHLNNEKEALQALQMCVPLLRRGGILVADNVLCNALVLEDEREAAPIVRGIQEFNRAIMHHIDLESVILPIRDGIAVCRRRD
jgi:predicted O-methyltransferase YrrM